MTNWLLGKSSRRLTIIRILINDQANDLNYPKIPFKVSVPVMVFIVSLKLVPFIVLNNKQRGREKWVYINSIAMFDFFKGFNLGLNTNA